MLYLSPIVLLSLVAVAPQPLPAQFSDARIVSEHVRVRAPQEREWLARDTVPDLERCWQFVHRLLGERLPRWLVVTLDWRTGAITSDPEQKTVSIGMLNRAADPDPKRYILHRAAREMARLGLIELSRGGAARPESEFLLDGMSEILAHEFDHTTRTLGGAWVLAQLMDRMQPLTVPPAPQAKRDPATVHELRTSAVGVTFLMTCQETFGREKVLKLFEGFRKASFEESVISTFKMSAKGVEGLWLKKIRQFPLSDATVTSDEDAPALGQVGLAWDASASPKTASISLVIADRNSDTPVEGIFVVDGSGVWEAQASAGKGKGPVTVHLPVTKGSESEPLQVQIVAVDEAGNVRVWPRTLPVK